MQPLPAFLLSCPGRGASLNDTHKKSWTALEFPEKNPPTIWLCLENTKKFAKHNLQPRRRILKSWTAVFVYQILLHVLQVQKRILTSWALSVAGGVASRPGLLKVEKNRVILKSSYHHLTNTLKLLIIKVRGGTF